jgi:hypothetical protein
MLNVLIAQQWFNICQLKLKIITMLHFTHYYVYIMEFMESLNGKLYVFFSFSFSSSFDLFIYFHHSRTNENHWVPCQPCHPLF